MIPSKGLSVVFVVFAASALGMSTGCAFLAFDADAFKRDGSGGATSSSGETTAGTGGSGSTTTSSTSSDSSTSTGSAMASCDDNMLNGAETSVDCGGGCICNVGSPCTGNSECKSGKCAGTCQPASCTDGVKNGSEGGVDCGGACPLLCANGEACTQPIDCVSAVCTSNICQTPTCFDGAKNGGESDVDCGGPCSTKCGTLKGCGGGSDCVSGTCSSNLCVDPSCGDGVKNGLETAIDCGGSCAPCGNGLACGVAADCGSGVCKGTPKTCATPSCSDGVSNGSETDLDCGGGCAPCVVGSTCALPGDCTSHVCSSFQCAAPSCSDGASNGSETDLDCGGPLCVPCADDLVCNGPLDCVSGGCTLGHCATWSARSGGDNHDFVGAQSMAAMPDGGFVIAGYSASTTLDLSGTMLPGHGFYDPWFARLSRTGAVLWGKRLGASGLDTGYAIAAHAATGRVGVVGTYSGMVDFGGPMLTSTGATDGYVLVVNASTGATLWAASVGNAGAETEAVRGVAFTSNGDVVTVGDVAGNNGDVQISRFAGATGALLWQKSLAGSDGDTGRGIAVDANDDVIITGSFGDPTGASAILDGFTLTNSNGRDAFVAKLAGATGNRLWSQTLAGALQSDGYVVLALPAGDIFFGGSARGPGQLASGPTLPVIQDYDAVFARLSGLDGSHVWSTAHGGPNDDTPRAVTLDLLSRPVFAGSVGGVVDFGNGTGLQPFGGAQDGFVTTLDPLNGQTLQAKTFGGTGDDYASGIARGNFGNLFIAGETSGPMDLGDGVKSKQGAGAGNFWASLGMVP